MRFSAFSKCDWDKWLRRSHLGRAIFWVFMIPVAMVFGWAQSIVFITIISLWALVEGALSSYFAELAKEEVKKSGDSC